MKRILVPYDFSEVATHALNFAADIARMNESCRVTVINVLEQPTQDTFKTMGIQNVDPMEELYIKKIFEAIKGKMEDLMADSTYKDIELHYKIVLGQPFKEISQEISTSNIELVVMGTSGAEGAEAFLVGSNAERMVRYSQCPVITLSRAYHPNKIKNIAFASNFYDLPEKFVGHIKNLQDAFKAKLTMVKINTPASFTSTRHDTRLIKGFIEKHGFENCDYAIYNFSNEEDGVVAFVEDVGGDMIAMGTRQKQGFGHFLSGSIAEDVVNQAKVPVWTFGLKLEK